jgi:hypothetical protein
VNFAVDRNDRQLSASNSLIEFFDQWTTLRRFWPKQHYLITTNQTLVLLKCESVQKRKLGGATLGQFRREKYRQFFNLFGS